MSWLYLHAGMILLLQTGDAWTTLLAIRSEAGQEANPLMRFVLRFGERAFWTVKCIAVAALLGLLFWVWPDYSPRLIIYLVLTYVVYAGAIWNNYRIATREAR